MGSFSDYWEVKLLDLTTGKAGVSTPTVFIGLSTADPLDDASGLAEPSGNGYTRVETSGATWNSAASGATDNAADMTFPEASGAWGTITHFALFDAVSGGNMIGHGSLSTPKTIDNGDTAKFSSGDLDITLD